MNDLFLLLSLLSVVALVVGIIKPSIVIRWGDEDTKNRKSVLKYYGIGIIVFFILFGITIPEEDDVEKAEIENEEELEEKEESENEEEPKEKKEEKEEKEIDSQELLEETNFKVNIRTALNYFVEEYEKQRIRKLDIKTTAVYSEDTVKDQAGNEFPYSFMASGRYEEKGTGALRDFVMTLGYSDDKALDKGNASCIQYINDDTGNYINVMDPEDDVILQMLEGEE